MWVRTVLRGHDIRVGTKTLLGFNHSFTPQVTHGSNKRDFFNFFRQVLGKFVTHFFQLRNYIPPQFGYLVITIIMGGWFNKKPHVFPPDPAWYVPPPYTGRLLEAPRIFSLFVFSGAHHICRPRCMAPRGTRRPEIGPSKKRGWYSPHLAKKTHLAPSKAQNCIFRGRIYLRGVQVNKSHLPVQRAFVWMVCMKWNGRKSRKCAANQNTSESDSG